MEKQLIISVGREFGSGGHEIAEYLAETFHLPLYDRNLLGEVIMEKNPAFKKSEFVERFLELSLFYGLSSPLNSEMICIFPYF